MRRIISLAAVTAVAVSLLTGCASGTSTPAPTVTPALIPSNPSAGFQEAVNTSFSYWRQHGGTETHVVYGKAGGQLVLSTDPKGQSNVKPDGTTVETALPAVTPGKIPNIDTVFADTCNKVNAPGFKDPETFICYTVTYKDQKQPYLYAVAPVKLIAYVRNTIVDDPQVKVAKDLVYETFMTYFAPPAASSAPGAATTTTTTATTK
jgi:hypothetical protein